MTAGRSVIADPGTGSPLRSKPLPHHVHVGLIIQLPTTR